MSGAEGAHHGRDEAPSGGETPAPSGTVAELTRRVIAGEFGNGDARRGALGSRYDEVQAEVNRILGGDSASGGSSSGGSGVDIEALAQAVIRRDYGNGDARRAALGANYDAVQARVNEILGAGGLRENPRMASISTLWRAPSSVAITATARSAGAGLARSTMPCRLV